MIQASKFSADKVKLPLVVHFTSNAVAEAGVDQGGVAKVLLLWDLNCRHFTLESSTFKYINTYINIL